MFLFRRASLAPVLAFALCATVAPAALALDAGAGDSGAVYVANDADRTPTALSSEDRLSYTTAFDALRRGDLELARSSARRAQDRVLLGQVEFERLFHPSHVATYDELAAWLETYSDLPMAQRVYTLAMRRLPDGAPEPKRPGNLLERTWASVTGATGAGTGGVTDPAKAARVALNNDDLAGAYRTGAEMGDWWSAGLAAWRLNEFSDAFRAFERVSQDPTEDPWVRAGAAFWTARAAAQSGRQDRVIEYLRLAARWPATFYGQVALRQLGEEPVIENLGPRAYQATLQRASFTPEPTGVDTRELNAFIRTDETARRTVALFEVGRRNEAEQAARDGMRAAGDDGARRLWAGLYRTVAPNRAAQTDAARIDALRYPMPELAPDGGFTIEKALVYAIARKETEFNATARSGAGAYGMMQVMPSTAAYMTGDQGYVRSPERLFVPATNLKLGQDYVNRLFQIESFQGDLLKAVASYNAGPGPMLAAIRKLGPDADPLLLIETIDVPQARDYVEKVVAAYWIYQRMMGAPLNTLDAVASGAKAVPIRLDYVAPPPAPLQVAEAVPVAETR